MHSNNFTFHISWYAQFFGVLGGWRTQLFVEANATGTVDLPLQPNFNAAVGIYSLISPDRGGVALLMYLSYDSAASGVEISGLNAAEIVITKPSNSMTLTITNSGTARTLVIQRISTLNTLP